MPHLFNVYEVDSEGGHHDTGKQVKIYDLPIFEGQRNVARGTVIQNLFALFGFSEYMNYYVLYPGRENGDIEVRYNYGDQGLKATWYLKRGA